MVGLATKALQDPDAWHGLTAFLEQSLRMQREDRGLKDMLTSPGLKPHRMSQSRDDIGPLIEQMVERAKQQGTLRPDFTSTDAIFIQVALAALMDLTRHAAPDLYRRYFTMFLDGLRADRGPLTPPPIEALSVEEAHAVMAPHDPTTLPPG